MRTPLAAVACIILAVATPAHGQIIFNANFDAQPLGPLTLGLPPDLPQFIITDPGATVNVVSSAGNLTNKPVLMHSVPNSLAAVEFENPSQMSSGEWRVSWDSLVASTPVNDPLIQNNFLITALSGGNLVAIFGIKYVPSGQFSVQDAAGFHTVGAFSVGLSDHFRLDLHLSSGTYELFVDGGSLLTGTLADNGQFLRTVFHSNGRTGYQLPDLAFDNLVVQSVPEPSALTLSAVAMLSVITVQYGRRLRRLVSKLYWPHMGPVYLRSFHQASGGVRLDRPRGFSPELCANQLHSADKNAAHEIGIIG
jgi:hypothetical protein